MMRSPHHLFGTVALYVSLLTLLCLTGVVARAAVLNVPADYPTIQAAIDAANPGDEVAIAPATYPENINFNGKAITVRSTNPTDPAVVAATAIDGQELGSVVAFASGEGASSVLSGLTINNGKATHGGGIYCDYSSPTITNNIISANSSTSPEGGGGVYCYRSGPTISNNTISGNSSRASGAGILSSASNPVVSNNTISGNSSGGNGGGISSVYSTGSDPIISNNTISGNSAGGSGGGISCSASNPTITNNTISANSSTSSDGGGIHCTNNSIPTIQNNTITGNSAASDGGGIVCAQSSATISGNTITGNSADQGGGGIYCTDNSSATIQNNTITGNSAASDGGGIVCAQSSATISGNTITGNSADQGGGGIYCTDNSSATIQNNTITGNSAGSWGGGIVCAQSSATIANNSILDNLTGGHGGGIYSVTSNPIISNNTISGNSAGMNAGGIYCAAANPTISGNTISGNSADQDGGGIYCLAYSSPAIQNNTISGNSAGDEGGGIYCWLSSPTITNNTITGNSAIGSGGGIYCDDSSPTIITNNTISHNSADLNGGGILCSDSEVTIRNCIVAFSTSGEGIYVVSGQVPQVSYCDVHGNDGGQYEGMPDPTGTEGNISEDPLFADSASGDYHLKSTGGRWNPSTASWVTDAVHSPCIDAGDPSSTYSNELPPNGGRINMGAYGNTAEASKSNRPPKPTDLAVTLGAGRQVDLTWTDNADHEDGFTVQRRKYDSTTGWPATWTTVKRLGANVTAWSDTSLTEDGRYQYRVRAYNEFGPSNWSRPAQIVVISIKPPTPADFWARLMDDNTARLSWTDSSDINTGFTLQRRQWDTGTGWPAGWTTVIWLGPNVERYDDTLTEDGIYQYRLRAYSLVGPSNWTRPRRIIRATTRPDAPSDLTLTAVPAGIRAEWTANAANAQGYALQKRKRNADGTWPDFAPPAKWLGPTVQSFTDTNLSGDGAYQYRVRAYNSQGSSTWASYARIAYVGAAGMPGALCSVAVTQANGQFVSIVYGLSAEADITIEVRNIAGRLVRAIPCGTAAAGLNTATWNLRNATGAPVPSGMYLCTITARTAAGTQATAVRTVQVRR